jgi:hypothetical protein
MSTIQQELFSRAVSLTEQHLSSHELFEPTWSQLLVVLSGSAPTKFADKFSSIDLVAVLPTQVYEGLLPELRERGFAGERAEFHEVQAAEHHLKLAVYSDEDVRAWLQEYDDFAMGIFRDARPVHDPGERFEDLIGARLEYPREVLAEKIRQRFSELRNRQASMAWNLRRGQPFVFLDNLVRLMSHAFTICFYLEGRPPVGRKWLFRGALRTETGRKLRPALFELFGLLGDLTTLGGSIDVRTCPLYTTVASLQERLAEAIADKGFN